MIIRGVVSVVPEPPSSPSSSSDLNVITSTLTSPAAPDSSVPLVKSLATVEDDSSSTSDEEFSDVDLGEFSRKSQQGEDEEVRSSEDRGVESAS
jgi:hypothetical protein